MCLPNKKNSISSASSGSEKPPSSESNLPDRMSPPASLDAKTSRENQQRLKEVFNEFGFKSPNPLFANALAKERAKQKKKVKHEDVPKHGDIVLSYKKHATKQESATDDTIYQRKKKKAYNYGSITVNVDDRNKYQISLPNDNDREEPTEQNYMANLKDIEYHAHTMLYTIDVKNMPKPRAKKNVSALDPFGPLDQLYCPAIFNREKLIRNTFISNALSFPRSEDENDRVMMKTALEEGNPTKGEQRVRWNSHIVKKIIYEYPEEETTAEMATDVDTGRDN